METHHITPARGLSETGLKWVALVTMVLDHIHYFFSFFIRFFPSGTIREYFSGGCLRHRKRCPGTLCHVCCI